MIDIKGYWKDTFIYPSGKIIEKEWKKNTICNSGLIGLCRILHGDTGFSGGISNIWYAVGSGESSWDSDLQSASSSDTILVNELNYTEARKNPTVFQFWNTAPTDTPAYTLFLETTLGATELVGEYLREFGVFIGNGTQDKDSGYLLNHVNHSMIHKGNFALKRQIKFVFSPSV